MVYLLLFCIIFEKLSLSYKASGGVKFSMARLIHILRGRSGGPCKVSPHTMVWYALIWYVTMWYAMVLFGTIHKVKYGMVWCGMVLYGSFGTTPALPEGGSAIKYR